MDYWTQISAMAMVRSGLIFTLRLLWNLEARTAELPGNTENYQVCMEMVIG